MLKTVRNFYDNWKIAKTLDFLVRASLVITGLALAEQALEALLAPQAVYAEEEPQQRLPEQLNVVHQHKYDIKIRESLALQKDFGNPDSAFQTIDHLCMKIIKKVEPRSRYNKEEAIKVLKVIGGVLKNEGKFEYRKNCLLIKGLKKQKNGKRFIDCDDYSSIYLIVGERLGLFLEPVYAPKHVFLMCSLDDSTRFYWEPTIGAERDVDFYKDWLNIPGDSRYPEVLDVKKFEAIQFCNLGSAWYEKGDYEKAIKYSTRAVGLNPNYAVAYNNLGVAYAKQGNFDKAIGCYKKAASINPNYATAFNNIGVVFYRLDCLQKAVEYFEKAIEADPRYDRAYNYKFIALMKKGEREKALKFLNQVNDLKSKTAIHSVN